MTRNNHKPFEPHLEKKQNTRTFRKQTDITRSLIAYIRSIGTPQPKHVSIEHSSLRLLWCGVVCTKIDQFVLFIVFFSEMF